MKRLVEHVKTHRKLVHAHFKKHHKKYFFGVLSAALLIKLIPAIIAGIATWHFNYSFADETQNNNTEISCPEGYEYGVYEHTIEGYQEGVVVKPKNPNNVNNQNDFQERLEDLEDKTMVQVEYGPITGCVRTDGKLEKCTESETYDYVFCSIDMILPNNECPEGYSFVPVGSEGPYDMCVKSSDSMIVIDTSGYIHKNNIPLQDDCEFFISMGMLPADGHCGEVSNTVDANPIPVSSTIDGVDVLTICNPEDETECITMMDRNLGSTTNDITKAGSYGYKFQWGNNYGFRDGCRDEGCSDDVTAGSLMLGSDTSGANRDDRYNNSGYYGTTFIRTSSHPFNYWADHETHSNLWGGGSDDAGNDWGYTVTNPTDRQGPCPEGYHVPSAGERNNVVKRWILQSDTGLREQGFKSTVPSNGAFLSNIGDHGGAYAFRIDFKIPLAGLRDMNNGKIGGYEDGYLWTSTTSGSVAPIAYHLDGYNVESINYYPAGDGMPVRCFKNSDVETETPSESETSTESETCASGNITITSPISGQILQSKDVRLTWRLNGSICSGETFAIKLYDGNNNGSYTTLGTVSANRGEFTDLENFNNSGSVETNFAIFLVGQNGEIVESIKEGPTFFIDNTKPEIVSSSYTFDPARTNTYGLNEKVNVSFTGSEELTGITVNVLGRNATFVSKSGLRYNYSIQLSSGNNTGQFVYNISFRDFAGNTGYYEKFDTGLSLDDVAPELSGGIRFTKTGDKAYVSMLVSEDSDITFTYILSGGKAGETLRNTGSNTFNSELSKVRVNLEDKIYKYAVTVQDKAGNKKYYAGAFWFSGGNIESTSVTADGSNISNTTGVSVLGTLRNEAAEYSGCKNNMKFKLITQTVRSGYTVKIEMPEYSSKSLQDTAEFLVEVLLGNRGLSKPGLSGFNGSMINSFSRDIDNYLVAVKLKRDPDVCDTKFSILPSLHTATLLKTLKSYGILK